MDFLILAVFEFIAFFVRFFWDFDGERAKKKLRKILIHRCARGQQLTVKERELYLRVTAQVEAEQKDPFNRMRRSLDQMISNLATDMEDSARNWKPRFSKTQSK